MIWLFMNAFSTKQETLAIIRQLNKEIDSIYTELGRKLFDSKVSGTENEYDEDVQRVIDLKSLIDSKKQRIEEIRSQIVCPNCGAKLEFDLGDLADATSAEDDED